MRLREDLKLHLVGGAAIAAALLLLLLLPRWVGPGGTGIAVMLGSVLAGWAIEAYQKVRREGTPDWRDWVATSAPGVLLGFAHGAWEALK